MLIPVFLLFSILGISNVRAQTSSESHCEAARSKPWTYDDSLGNGPYYWGQTYPNCNGDSQSPIDLVENEAEANSDLQALALSGYDIPVANATVLNEGFSVAITPDDGVTRTLTIDGTTYNFLNLQFCWGPTDRTGSEHAYNGKNYAMEAQFTHVSDDNKVAILVVLYDAITSEYENPSLRPIFQELPRVLYENDQVDMQSSFDLSNSLTDVSSYFRYQGSSTYPPCDEGVTWSVLETVATVGSSQLDKLRDLYEVPKDQASEECHLLVNYRPLQPLNNRVVYKTS